MSAAVPEEDRLRRQFSFLLEMDSEKCVQRQTYLADGSRKENDAEHAWHLAMMALVLGEYANEPIDLLKTVTMVLLHDVVEIDAGDTYAYDELGKQSQAVREVAAADRLFSLLPPDQGKQFRAVWDEFEAWKTPEARFAHALDNVQPAMLNHASAGRSWLENGVHLHQILDRNRRTGDGSRPLWDYARDHFILPHTESGEIKSDTST